MPQFLHIDRGEYGVARDAMFPLWKGIGSRPDTKELREDLVPRVLLVAGILTGWLGGQSEIQKDKDPARDLISESIRLYEELGDIRKVAEARVELAQCYWRAGDNDTARILLSTALERLTTGGPAQANALLILSSVEWAESRYNEVLKILTLNAPLFERITNHTIKGVYHNQLGITLRAIGASKKRPNYFQRAIQQYHLADEEFRLAKHPSFRVLVKNNIGVNAVNLRIPADCGHQFRAIVGSDSGPSWAPIPVHRGQLERPMLELFHWRQTSWLPPTLREETTIDVSPEGRYASGQRSLALNGGRSESASDCPQSPFKPWRSRQISGSSATCRS